MTPNHYTVYCRSHVRQVTSKNIRGSTIGETSIKHILFAEDRSLNTLRPRQDGRRFADDTFKRIFLNENVWISIEVSLKFVPKGPINNIPALVQIMAWRRPGDKPLFEPMMVSLLTHICVTRPQWVNYVRKKNWSTTIIWRSGTILPTM